MSIDLDDTCYNRVLTPQTCPLLRDSLDSYKPLERHFGTLTTGMAFGESFMLGGSDRNRFYNAIAMTDCYCLSLSKESFDYIMCSSERKIFNDKMIFLRSLPEFRHLSLPRQKLEYLCTNLMPVSCIKNRVIFREGEQNKFVYFVRSGEF